MTVSSNSASTGKPTFSNVASTQADLQAAVDWAEQVGNARTGTSAERTALTTLKNGLLFFDTTTGYLWVYNSGWSILRATVFGHMGQTSGFYNVSTTNTLVVMSAAQDLVGGMTFDSASSSLQVPIAGRYRITVNAYISGGAGGSPGQAAVYKNGATFTSTPQAQFWKASTNDVSATIVATTSLSASDKIQLRMTYPGSSYGTTGYNGSYIEVEYIGG